MHPVIQKTLGGLLPQYYFRQIFFGLFVAAFFYLVTTMTGPMTVGILFFIIVSTLFYPYSRFVYESIADFIVGDNVYFVSSISMLVTKFITMTMCWVFALFVAPIGLAYLYYRHSKAESD